MERGDKSSPTLRAAQELFPIVHITIIFFSNISVIENSLYLVLWWYIYQIPLDIL